MAEFKVTPQKLKNTASNIDTAKLKIQASLDGIKTEMQNMRLKWDSDAATEFINKFNTFSKNFETYYKVIDSYGKFLVSSAESYELTDKNIQSDAGNLFT